LFVVNSYHSRVQSLPSVTFTYHRYVVPPDRLPVIVALILVSVLLSLAPLSEPISLCIVQFRLSPISESLTVQFIVVFVVGTLVLPLVGISKLITGLLFPVVKK